MNTPKLMTTKRIKDVLFSLEGQVRDASISAMYHAAIHGNVEWATGWDKANASQLDACIRQVLPMEFNKDTKGYRYSKTKGTKFNETHGFVFGETTFDVFYCKMRAYWDANSIKVAAKTLSDEEKQFSKRSALASLLNGWAAAGLPFAEVEVMLFNAKKGITNKVAKPVPLTGTPVGELSA
jgi:hypothetical protein